MTTVDFEQTILDSPYGKASIEVNDKDWDKQLQQIEDQSPPGEPPIEAPSNTSGPEQIVLFVTLDNPIPDDELEEIGTQVYLYLRNAWGAINVQTARR